MGLDPEIKPEEGKKEPVDGQNPTEDENSSILKQDTEPKEKAVQVTALNLVPKTPGDSQSNIKDLQQVVQSLEQRVTKLADEGANVGRISTILDTLNAAIASGKPGSFNKELNEIRSGINAAPIQQAYSEGCKPWPIAFYELFICGVLLTLVVANWSAISGLFSETSWSLPVIYGMGLFAGCIGAILTALGGLYRHRINKTLDPSFELWYFLKPFVGAFMGGFIAILANILVTGVNVSGNGQQIVVIISGFIAGLKERDAVEFLQSFADKYMLQKNLTDSKSDNSSTKGTGTGQAAKV